MVGNSFSTLEVLLLAVLTAAGLRFYLPVARTVLVRNAGCVGTGWVGRLDVVVALVLMAWFAMQGQAALAENEVRAMEFHHVVIGAALYGAIVLLLLGVMIYRNISPVAAFGWGALSFRRALGRGLLYIAAAYPLLILVQGMVHGAAGSEAPPQEVVRFLAESQSARDRVAVLAMAVIVAPLAEELVFRGYFYAVIKKYAGSFVALAVTSLLFAAVHGHAHSIPALFTLAFCLGLAYERTGSLLVAMIMHAVFNAFQVGLILFVL